MYVVSVICVCLDVCLDVWMSRVFTLFVLYFWTATAMSVDSAGPRRSVIDIDAEETDGNVSVGFGGPLDQSLHSLSWKGTVNHSSPVPKRPSKARAIVSDEGDNEEDTLGDMAGVGEPDGVKGTSMQSLMRPKKPSAVTFSSMDELFP